MNTDHALASRIETVISAQNAAWAATAARLGIFSDAVTIPIAGGNAIFAGTQSPVTKGTGIGVADPITAAELDTFEAFFRSRSATPRLEVCPLAPDPLHRLLRTRGYRLDGFTSMHVREANPADLAPAPTDIRIVRVAPNLLDTFCETLGRGFAEGAEPPATVRDLPRATFHNPISTCFLAYLDGQPAGAAGMAITPAGPAFPGHSRPLAALFGASTLPAARRRGIQTALVAIRLAHAAAAGCDLAVIHSKPGTSSERNIARAGFRLAYTKAVMSLD
jgi:GNAT superfamily N-acetyltransferase